MATKDLYNHISASITLSPAARTASANGIGVDLQGYESAVVVVTAGTVTDGTHTIEVQESDVLASGYTAVADDDLQGTEPALASTDDDEIHEIGYIGTKRYIRAIVTVAGATTGAVVGVNVVKGHARHQPA